jgi:hypothetical protein
LWWRGLEMEVKKSIGCKEEKKENEKTTNK